MRKLVYGGAVSLDGYLARENGAVDWIAYSRDAMELMREMWPRFDAMVMGRKTWTTSIQNFSEEDLKKAREYRSGMRTVVFSSILEAGERDGVEFVNIDAAEFLRSIKDEPGKDIMLMGGGELAKSMFEAHLIDEVGLNIHPILLGSGVPTFLRLTADVPLSLLECRELSGGCVYVRYSVNH